MHRVNEYSLCSHIFRVVMVLVRSLGGAGVTLGVREPAVLSNKAQATTEYRNMYRNARFEHSCVNKCSMCSHICGGVKVFVRSIGGAGGHVGCSGTGLFIKESPGAQNIVICAETHVLSTPV